MKKSAIIEMMYARRRSMELISPSVAEREARKKYFDAEEPFIASLTEEQKKLYETAMDAKVECFCEEVDTHYKEGFKFGVLMGLDIAEE